MRKNKTSSSGWKPWVLIIVIFLVAEIFFDIFEIAVGRFLLWTNPIRPKTGRLWEEEEKDQSGSLTVNEIEKTPEQENQQPIRRVDDLLAALSMRDSYTMTIEEFTMFYKSIPIHHSKTLLDPLEFIRLDRNPDWQSVRFSRTDDQIVIDFLDGYDNLLYENIIRRQALESEDGAPSSVLAEKDEFEGRVVSALTFFDAFENLSRAYQLQIVNDPYKLVQWGKSLQQVGISPYVREQGVKIVFKVDANGETKVYEMYASEIAIGYLIKEINKNKDISPLDLPVEKKDE